MTCGRSHGSRGLVGDVAEPGKQDRTRNASVHACSAKQRPCDACTRPSRSVCVRPVCVRPVCGASSVLRRPAWSYTTVERHRMFNVSVSCGAGRCEVWGPGARAPGPLFA